MEVDEWRPAKPTVKSQDFHSNNCENDLNFLKISFNKWPAWNEIYGVDGYGHRVSSRQRMLRKLPSERGNLHVRLLTRLLEITSNDRIYILFQVNWY